MTPGSMRTPCEGTSMRSASAVSCASTRRTGSGTPSAASARRWCGRGRGRALGWGRSRWSLLAATVHNTAPLRGRVRPYAGTFDIRHGQLLASWSISLEQYHHSGRTPWRFADRDGIPYRLLPHTEPVFTVDAARTPARGVPNPMASSSPATTQQRAYPEASCCLSGNASEQISRDAIHRSVIRTSVRMRSVSIPLNRYSGGRNSPPMKTRGLR